MVKTISAGEFKANCLKLMDQVREQRTELVITKRGKPVARLTPIDAEAPSVFGCMVGTAEVRGDLVEAVVAAGEWESTQ